jgi:Flp pilus assembly protein TadD
MGFAVLAGAGLLHLTLRYAGRKDGGVRAVLSLGIAGLLALCVTATFHQSDHWKSSLTLWERGVEVSPRSSVAHVNYADALAAAGIPQGAVSEYLRGLELNPRDWIATHHLADILAQNGHRDRAVALYQRTLELKPDLGVVYPKLAHLLILTGRPHEAVPMLRDWVQKNPGDLEAALFLADLLCTYPDETIRDGEEAERLARRVSDSRRGVDGGVLLVLASALAEMGRFEESIAVAEEAVALANEEEDHRLVSELQHRLELFRLGKPYHFGD